MKTEHLKSVFCKTQLERKTGTLFCPQLQVFVFASRAEDHSRPYFEDLPPIGEEIRNHKKSTQSTTSEAKDSKWVVEQSAYIGVCLVNAPFLTKDTMFVPHARLDDGAMYLVMLRDTLTRGDLLKMLLKVEDGSHVGIPGLEIIPVQAARIEPLESGRDAGIMVLDGEKIDTTVVQSHVMPKAARVFSK